MSAHTGNSPSELRSHFPVFKLLDLISDVSFVIASAIFALVMLLGVFFRYVLNSSLTWADELSLVFFVWATLLSVATGYQHDKHVRIDIFLPRLPDWARPTATRLAEGLEAAFLVCLFVSAISSLETISGSHTDVLRLPYTVAFIALPLACALMLVHWLRRAINAGSISGALQSLLIAAAFFLFAFLPAGKYIAFAGSGRTALIICSFVLPLVVGVPIAFALGLMGFFYIGILGRVPFSTGAMQIFFGTEVYTYMAIPLLMLSGMLLYTAGIAERLIDFAQVLVGRMRGGLGATNVIASLIFADISGSAVSDTAAIGSAMIPEMKRRGYRADFCAALQGSAGTLGLMFPPAIVLLLYATTINVSVSRLFAASIIPGLLVAISFILVTYLHAIRHGYPSVVVPRSQILSRTIRAAPGMFAGVIVVGGILGGVITPAEAGVILLAYVLLLLVFLYRSASPNQVYRVVVEAGHTSGMTLFLTATSAVVGFVLARDLVPIALVDTVTGLFQDKYVIILVMNLIFIVAGMFLEPPAIIVAFLPSFVPLLQKIGMDPLQWGIIFVINAGIGMLTPPVGLTLFVSAAIANVPFSVAVRAAIPFMLIMIVDLIIVSIFPIVSLWLPHILYGHPL